MAFSFFGILPFCAQRKSENCCFRDERQPTGSRKEMLGSLVDNFEKVMAQ